MHVLGIAGLAVLILFGLAALWMTVPPTLSILVTLVAIGVFLWRTRG